MKFNKEINTLILHHLNHEKVEIEETHDESIKHIDYSKAWNEGIK